MVMVMLLRMVLYSPILAIGGIVMVSQTNVSMSWIIVLAVMVIAIIIGILMAVAMPKFKMMQKLIDRVNLVSREMLTGLSVIRAFDRQQYEGRTLRQGKHGAVSYAAVHESDHGIHDAYDDVGYECCFGSYRGWAEPTLIRARFRPAT